MSWHHQTDFFSLAATHGSPLWVYDAATIKAQIARLRAFDVIRFAQKACSNLHILRLMRNEGVRVDAVSLGEIERALAAGFVAEGDASSGSTHELVFTADLFDRATLARVAELKIETNCGSIDMLRQLGQVSPGHRVWLRINPGFGHGHSNKTNTGGENSKHGIWHEQLAEALALVREYGLHLVGIHMHIGSGVDYGHLQQVCGAMVDLVSQVRRLGHDLEAISSGGGLSIPYRPGSEQTEEVDTDHYFALWQQARHEIARLLGHTVRLEIEPGRFLVAQAGALLAEVRAIKHQGAQQFALLDAGFNDLMRPALYGSYHHISRLTQRADADADSTVQDYVVGGPLCESGDVFTQIDGGVVETRRLPTLAVGDLVLFHDTGAYGASMSSNYNSRGLLPEVLLENGAPRLIRRRQTITDLLQLELGL
jgi:diaminopimelate decarboxylase